MRPILSRQLSGSAMPNRSQMEACQMKNGGASIVPCIFPPLSAQQEFEFVLQPGPVPPDPIVVHPMLLESSLDSPKAPCTILTVHMDGPHSVLADAQQLRHVAATDVCSTDY
jgi:hypothetical protein